MNCAQRTGWQNVEKSAATAYRMNARLLTVFVLSDCCKRKLTTTVCFLTIASLLPFSAVAHRPLPFLIIFSSRECVCGRMCKVPAGWSGKYLVTINQRVVSIRIRRPQALIYPNCLQQQVHPLQLLNPCSISRLSINHIFHNSH